MNLNSDNSFINLLYTEKDVLLKILKKLPTSTILSLGKSCLAIYGMFQDCGVWDDLVQRWSLSSGLGYNHYDWEGRLGTSYDFEVVEKLALLTSRYRSGPVSSLTLSVRESAKAVVTSDHCVGLLLHSGTVRIFNRRDLSEVTTAILPAPSERALEQISIRGVSYLTRSG